MQAQYGHRAIKCYLREFCECKNGRARIILSAPRISQTVTLFNNLSCLPFYNEAYINRCALAFKRINGTLPHYLNTSLRKISDNHTRITRNCNLNLLSTPHPSTKTAQKGDAPLQWELLRTGITYPEPWELRRLWHPSSQNYGKYR